MKFRMYAAIALVVALGWVSPARAGEDIEAAGLERRDAPLGSFSLVFENDRTAATDRHYTHGSYASWTSAPGRVPGLLERLGASIPLLETGADRVGYVLGQTMFTPDNISTRRLVENDRPYAGWLYGGLRLVSEQADGLQRLELDLGVVGPASQADDIQKIVHQVLGVQRPNGWDNQLDNEPGALLIYERKWRNIGAVGGLEGALIPHVSAAVGNVMTLGAAGGTLAIGRNLDANWGPPRIYPGIRGTDHDAGDGASLHWSLFAGGEARLVAHNVFLDGNTFSDSHSVDRNLLVGDVQAGLQVSYGPARLAFTYVVRTREFEGQDEHDRFGSVTLSVRF